MRIAYVCQYFVPEIGAPSARLSEMSREWAALGHDVTVVTGIPNHPTGIVPPEYRSVVFRRETLGPVKVWRNWLYATPNEGVVKKTLSHLTFMLSVLFLSGPRLRRQDVMIVSSPTFFVVISVFLIGFVWRIPYVFEVRDLWPQIFVELGVLKNRHIIRILEAVEMFLYRRAAKVVVVTDTFREQLLARGLPADKVVVVTNGVDGAMFKTAARDEAIRREHNMSGKFVVLYIGAHGISHSLSAVVRAAEAMREDPDVVFAFVGEGADKPKIMQLAASLGLTNVRFVPGQPRDHVPRWYAAADVALIPLRNVPLFGGFIPSKMFEIMASGRPFIGSVVGEPRRILEASGGGIVIDPEDTEAMVQAIRRLKNDPALAEQMAQAGRRFVMENYDRGVLARKYLATLEGIVGSRS